MFRDAAMRIVQAAESIGICGLPAHAIPDDARAFRLGLGLDESPLDPMTLIKTIADLKAALEDWRLRLSPRRRLRVTRSEGSAGSPNLP